MSVHGGSVILTRIYGYGCLVLLCASLTLGVLWQYEVGRKHKLIASMAKAQVAAQLEANERAADLQRRLDSLPKAEEPIREVVRQNPAVCDRPLPVADGLSEAIRAANAARKVPADS